jgi:hypothetical protein
VAQIATGQTMHLSPYCIHSKKKGSGGGTDGGGDDGATPADGGDDGPVDSGPDAAGCKPGALQAGSCANHPVQICTAGYVFTNCVDQMPQGIRYSCCPAGA